MAQDNTAFEVGDKVYKFVNTRLADGTYIVAKKDDEYLYVIPTDCTINGEVPTLENYKPEKYPYDGISFVPVLARLRIVKADGELKDMVDKYRTHKLAIDKIIEYLKFDNYKYRKLAKEVLMDKTTDQLFAILLILYKKADGKDGVVYIKEDGKMETQLFMPKEPIREIKEPTD